jgi:hypothetical protein
VRLASAISKAEHLSVDGEVDNPLRDEQERIETIYRLYAVAETSLCVAHVGRRLQRDAGHSFKSLAPLFRESVAAIVSLADELQPDSGRRMIPANLKKYVEEVSRKSSRLVGLRSKEKGHAG